MSWNAEEKPVSVMPQKCFKQLQNFARHCLQNELETLFLMISMRQYESNYFLSSKRTASSESPSKLFFFFPDLESICGPDKGTVWTASCERRCTACCRNPGPKNVNMQLAEKGSKIHGGLI